MKSIRLKVQYRNCKNYRNCRQKVDKIGTKPNVCNMLLMITEKNQYGE